MADPTQGGDVSAPASIDVYALIMVMAEQMSAVAWQKLGLQPDMISGKVVQDLDQAKVVIDLTAHLASFIEPRVDDEDRRRLHNLVRDLRLNYVEKAREQS